MYDSGNDKSLLWKPGIADVDFQKESMYWIWTDDIIIASSAIVLDGDTMSFTLPFTEDEDDGDDSDYGACYKDMVVHISTNDNPANISWTLVDSNTGEVLVKGGPFEKPFGKWYTTRACLPDGDFVFTINAQDGLSMPSFYSLRVEGTTLVDAGDGTNFGSTASHSFTLPLGQMASSAPTKSSAPSSTMIPTVAPSLSVSPTETCDWVKVQVDYDWTVWAIVWEIRRILPSGDAAVVQEGRDGGVKEAYIKTVCLEEGQYDFAISSEWTGRGAFFPGRYSVVVVSSGDLIAQGEGIGEEQRTSFELPLNFE